MKTGICDICRKPFKLNRPGKLYRHGYKQEIQIKKWEGFIYDVVKRRYKLIKMPCLGSGSYPTILIGKDN